MLPFLAVQPCVRLSLLGFILLVCPLQILSKDLIYSGFDGNLNAGNGRTWEAKDVKLEKGVNRRALSCQDGGFAALGEDVKFRQDQGSIEFWVRTHWAGNDGQTRLLHAIGRTAGLRLMKLPNNELSFIWQPSKSSPSLKLGFDISKEWPANEWRHIAMTWKDNVFALYLDGVPRRSEETEQPVPPLTETSPVLLGSIKQEPGIVSYDEYVLRDKALTEKEVIQRYTRGMALLELDDDPRLVMRGLVGKHPVSLIMDTGSSENVLFSSFPGMDDIKALPSYRGGKLFNKEARVPLALPDGGEFTQTFAIMESPGEFAWHGLVGWTRFFEANRLQILWDRRTMKPIGEASVTGLSDEWRALDIIPGMGNLKLPPVTFKVGSVELTLPVVVDTGEGIGLSLTAATWKKHLPRWTSFPRGYQLRWTPAGGTQTRSSVVPDQIILFGHTLNGVSVEEDGHSRPDGEQQEQMRIGLSALSFFEVMIDGKGGKLFLKPRPKAAVRASINGSGLLFMQDGDILLLIAVQDSLAWKAGLRTDDQVLEWDSIPMKQGEAGMDMHNDIRKVINNRQAIRLKIKRGSQTLDIAIPKQ
jgi:hypothetical protein